MSCLIWKENVSTAYEMPMELLAAALISSAFSRPSLPLLTLWIKFASLVVEISENSSGVENFYRSSLLVVPKISQKTVSYSGNT